MNPLDRTSLQTKNGLAYFHIPKIARLGWIRHGFLTRKGGVSLPPYDSLNLSVSTGDREEHVLQNRGLIATAFGFKSENLVLLNQMHQDRVLVLKGRMSKLPSRLEYDAMITNIPNTFLAIRTADCIPIFIVDQKTKVVAAVHAGRQGTALQITRKVLKKMEEEFGCRGTHLLIGIGPSIRSCCYEIDGRVFQQEWEPFASAKKNTKWMIDLATINIAQMGMDGIRREQMAWINLCTSCHSDLFFSYRKEGRTGRQLSFIGMV
jgi:YfiH family protein